MDLHLVDPSKAGFDAGALRDAIAFHEANESTIDRDLAKALDGGHFGEPMPLGARIGPVRPRGGPSGVILRNGQMVAQWGDIDRVDVTFSISKSYLALLTGLAVADGLIPDIDAPVRDLVDDGGFDSDQNRAITWTQLLHLTSEWEGTLWDKPDWIDHYRELTDLGTRPPIGTRRPLADPGAHWEYNDVRVNRLALALLRVFRRPLPDILAERIMAPIGASDTWAWHGYKNSFVEIDGQRMQSVSGGAHWGGGLWISARDHARVGQMLLQGGVWNGAEIIPQSWVDFCRTPCPLNANYGALWWLNTDQTMYPGASADSYFGMGVGTQLLWIDPANDMVAVLRWIEKDAAPELVARVARAVL
ncbi:MAG: serine hydrolase [Pseudomonadota bacterium]